MKVVWVHNDQTIADTPEFRYRDDGGGHFSLVIRDIFPEDAGVYFCEAYNKHGGAHCHAQLSIHGGLLLNCETRCVAKDRHDSRQRQRRLYPVELEDIRDSNYNTCTLLLVSGCNSIAVSHTFHLIIHSNLHT